MGDRGWNCTDRGQILGCYGYCETANAVDSAGLPCRTMPRDTPGQRCLATSGWWLPRSPQSGAAGAPVPKVHTVHTVPQVHTVHTVPQMHTVVPDCSMKTSAWLTCLVPQVHTVHTVHTTHHRMADTHHPSGPSSRELILRRARARITGPSSLVEHFGFCVCVLRLRFAFCVLHSAYQAADANRHRTLDFI